MLQGKIIRVDVKRKGIGVGPGGVTNKPCLLCGRKYVDRMRIVYEYSEPDDEGHTQSVMNICISECANVFFRLNILIVWKQGLLSATAGKVLDSKCSEQYKCFRCGESAVGGIWAGINTAGRVRRGEGLEDVKMLCCDCSTQRAEDPDVIDMIERMRGDGYFR